MKPALTSFLCAITFAALAAPALAAGPGAPPKVDVKRGQTIASQVCMACHGVDGNSALPENPKLAAQHPEYLARQLRDYREGRRVNAIMQGFAAQLSDQDILDVSAFYASQPLEQGQATDPELVELGESIYRGGIANRNIPACAACHGPAGSGIPSQYPRLGGQHAAYTAAQLRLYRDGERANNQMNTIAQHMSDREIRAVSDYIAGLR